MGGVEFSSGSADREAVIALEECPETRQGRQEAQGYPYEQHAVDDDDGRFQERPALVREQAPMT